MVGGYNDTLKKAQMKIDKVPYEEFPFCCSSNVNRQHELNLKPPEKLNMAEKEI